MKKILFAALAAGVLSFAAAPMANADSVHIGIGNHGNVGVGVKIGNGHPGWHKGWRKHCRMVTVWRHHRKIWVRRCW